MQIERFSKQLPGIVWNMLLDQRNERLVLEVRQQDQKRVSFWVLDTISKKWLWEEVEFEESWWLNLHAISEDKIFLNYFTDKSNPDSKKIIEVDIAKMEVTDELKEVPSSNSEKLKPNNLLISPLHYTEGNPHFDTVKLFIKRIKNHDILKAVDYMEHDNKVYISYYIYHERKMDNFLLVVDENGCVIIDEKLGDNLNSVGLGTFFTYSNTLITVKNKTEILIYQC